MTREEFAKTSWSMTYEQYQLCYCPNCGKANCPHRGAYRRVPEIDGGLGLCPNLKEENEMKDFVEEFITSFFTNYVEDYTWDDYASPEEAITDTENYLSEFTVELAKHLHTPEFKAFVTEQWERHKQN